MNTRLHTAITLVALGLASTAVSRNAGACGIGDISQPADAQWSMPVLSSGAVPGSGAKDTQPQPSPNDLAFLRDPITGLYEFSFVSEGSDGIPDGTVVDHGFVTWHDDGTEIMNSGKPPITSSFCMGVWRHTGLRSYKLNHEALSWNDSGTAFVGPANIRENIQLSHNGSSYSGNFLLTQYSTDGTTILAQVQGTVSGTRITPDSN